MQLVIVIKVNIELKDKKQNQKMYKELFKQMRKKIPNMSITNDDHSECDDRIEKRVHFVVAVGQAAHNINEMNKNNLNI